MKHKAFSMTLNLTAEESEVLTNLCIATGLNKTQAIRQALRLYQLARERRLEWRDPDQPSKRFELVIL